MKNQLKITICCWMGLWINAVCPAQTIESTYRNPVIAGDFPDPTVIRVGENYYAAGTSSDFAPNYPLYHSVDLINWNRIGSIFNTPPEWIKGDCWAPELTYHNGTYFVYYTARKKANNVSCIGVATTKDISQGFEDQGVLIEWGNEAIDAFVFQDADGKHYITWKAYGLDTSRPIEILCSELSQNGLSLIGKPFSLTDHANGWIGSDCEGQCLIRRGEYYYLFYSVGGCCDRLCDYRVLVSRSKNFRSGWEQYSQNPILQSGGLWKCPGHGTVVETPDKRFFYLYHAYQTYDFEFVGRQGLLDEICWDTVGWPYFRYGAAPSAQAETPFKNTVQKTISRFFDNFKSDEKKRFWSEDMNLAGSCFHVHVIQPVSGNYILETAVQPDENQYLKGLTVYGDSSNYVVWGIENQHLRLYQREKGKRTEIFSQYLNAFEIYFRIESINARFFRFYWSEDRENWYPALASGTVLDGGFLPQWGKGLRVGLFVENQKENMAGFSYFLMENR